MSEQEIILTFRETNFHTRWPCTICGGHTEKVSVLTEGEQSLGDGDTCKIRVCETCLEGRDGLSIDQRLDLRALGLQADALRIRGLIGRLKVPTYAEWQARETRVDVATYASWCMGSAHGDSAPEAEGTYDKVLTDDAVYAEWRHSYEEDMAARAAAVASAGMLGDDEWPF